MNDSSQRTSPLRQRMIEDILMRKLAPKTQSSYIRAVRHFAGYPGRSPDTASAEDLRRYQLHCVDRGVSPITLNATITGLKFFFEGTLDRGELMAKIRPVRVAHTLPVILSREEVGRLWRWDRETATMAGPLRARIVFNLSYRTSRKIVRSSLNYSAVSMCSAA
jgi:site-specific recombinase XerD